MKNLTKNTCLVLVSLVLAIVAAEFLSRLAYPIYYGHKYFSLEGKPVNPLGPENKILNPGITYRQKTQEFDKITTHTSRGFRGPMDPAEPRVIFIGDSMTYGIGLADQETIPFLYCQQRQLSCINLGWPGSSTREQIEILKYFLEKYNWQPTRIILIMNVMTSSLMSGNDLTDNLSDSPPAKKIKQGNLSSSEMPELIVQKQTTWQWLIGHRKKILEHSNLARLSYYIFAPVMRARMAPKAEEARLQQALNLTQQYLRELEEYAKNQGALLTIFLVHPMQDLINGTWPRTFTAIRNIAPERVKVIDTAEALTGNPHPEFYYYPMDAHVRAEGAQLIANYMAAGDL